MQIQKKVRMTVIKEVKMAKFVVALAGIVLCFSLAAQGSSHPGNSIYLAHFAIGGGQSTIVALSNPGEETVMATVRFFSSDGTPVPVRLVGSEEPMEVVTRTLAPRSSVGVETVGGTEAQSGWVQVESTGTLRATSIFRFSDFGPTFRIIEAAVADAPATQRANVLIEYLKPTFFPHQFRISTAIALANPFGETARITLRLLNAEAQQVREGQFNLESRRQLARFVEEIFEDFPATSRGVDDPVVFDGTLQIESDQPIVVTALRTLDGFQLSSVPVGQTTR